MPRPQLASASYVLALPSCPKCGTRMLLVQIVSLSLCEDERTYECSRCEHEIMEIVAFKQAGFAGGWQA